MRFLLLVVAAIAVCGLFAPSVPVDNDKSKDLPSLDASEPPNSSSHFSPSVSSIGTRDLTQFSPSRPSDRRGRRLGQRPLAGDNYIFAEKSVLNSSASAFNASNSGRIRRRFRRDAKDDFSSSVDKMSKISRVINGIALQQGLTKGSIQSDTLISELLNIGSLTTSSVQNLNSDALKQLVVDIQELPSKLGTNPNIETVESRFLIYAQILKWTDGIGKELKVEKQAEYLKAVKELEDATYKPDELADDLSFLQTFLNTLITLDQDKKFGKGTTTFNLGSIATTYSLVKSLNSYKDALLKNEVLTTGDKMFGPLKLVRDAVELYQKKTAVINYSSNDNSAMENVGGFMNLLKELAERCQSIGKDLQILYQLLVTRHHLSENRGLTLTSGFPNGPSDLDSITKDLTDAWIQSAVDGQSEGLAKALEPLKSLAEEFKNSDRLLMLEDSDSTVVSSVIDETAKLSLFVDVFDSKLAELTETMKIESSMGEMEPSNRLKFNPLFVNILLLSKHLNAAKKVADVVETLMKPENKHMKNILALVENPTADTAFALLDKLKADPSFKFVLELVRGAQDSIAVLTSDESKQNPPIIPETAKKISPAFNEFDMYLKGLSNFLTEFDKLRKIDGINKLGSSINTIQDLRKTSFSGGSMDTVAVKIEEAKKSLTGIQKTIQEMKDQNKDSKVLTELEDVLQDSQTVGSATRVFRSMEMMPESRVVVLDQSLVKEIQNKMKEMDSEDQKVLKQLLDLDNQLTAVYGQLDTVKKAVTSPTSDLSSLYPIFESAETASGIPINFLNIVKTVEKLSLDPTLTVDQQKELLEIQKKLKTLDSIGLDFARHHSAIGESKKALDQLDVFFSSYKTKITPIVVKPPPKSPGKPVQPPPPSSGGQSNSNSPSSGAVRAPTPPEEPRFLEKYGIYLLIIVTLALIGAGVAIYFCYFKKKKSSQPVPKSEYKPLNQVAPLPPPKEKEEEYLEVQSTQRSYRILWSPVTLAICNAYIADVYDKCWTACKERARVYTTALLETNVDLFKHFNANNVMKWKDAPEIEGAVPWIRGEIPLRAKGHFGLSNYDMFEASRRPILHANILKFNNDFEICMMQSPQAENLKDKANPKYSTILSFWLAVLDKQCQFIVMWEGFGKDDVNCARYFPMEKGETVTFGSAKITCEGVEEHVEMEYTIRWLIVTYPGRQTIKLRHIFFTGWPENGAVPTRTGGILEIIRMIESSTSTVFMHCANGIGPCTVAPFAMMNRERLVKDNGNLSLIDTFPEIRRVRGNAMPKNDEFLLAVCLTFRLVYGEVDKKQLLEKTVVWGDKLDTAFTNALVYRSRDVQIKIDEKLQAEKNEKSRERRIGENKNNEKKSEKEVEKKGKKEEKKEEKTKTQNDVL